MHRLVRAGACAFAALGVSAQGRVWIVDAANGAGTNFTNLPPAIAAAADGDQIWVRPGSYSAVSTGKALTILGDSGAWSAPAIEVSGLPAGRDFVLHGFNSSSVQPQVRVRNCAGRVLLDRLRLSPPSGQLTYNTPAIEIVNSALVTVQQGTVTGYPAVTASASTVHVTDSALTGGNAVLTFTIQASQPAVNITGGKLEVTNSQLRGGNGFVAAQTPPPRPALIANGSTLRIAGDAASCRLIAGTGTTIPAPALRGTLGSLRIDPNVVLTPYLTAPPIEGTIAVQTLRLPALRALGAPPGGVVPLDLFAPVGDLAALFVGQPADLLPLPMFGGDLGLDPTRMLHILASTIGATGHLTLNVPVPNNPSLRGANWVWQGVSGTLQGGLLLTNRANYSNA